MIKIFVPVKDFFDNGGVLVEGRSLYVPANHKKTEFVEVGRYITDKSQASTFSVNNLDTALAVLDIRDNNEHNIYDLDRLYMQIETTPIWK